MASKICYVLFSILCSEKAESFWMIEERQVLYLFYEMLQSNQVLFIFFKVQIREGGVENLSYDMIQSVNKIVILALCRGVRVKFGPN